MTETGRDRETKTEIEKDTHTQGENRRDGTS